MAETLDLVATTHRFLDRLETGDRAGLAEMLDPDIAWSAPMTASGDPDDVDEATGVAAFAARLEFIAALMSSARFADRRVTPSADGNTSFVQTTGDFRTADGRPYRNVYVFRLDWRNGRVATWEEYANPMTILKTFPASSAT